MKAVIAGFSLTPAHRSRPLPAAEGAGERIGLHEAKQHGDRHRIELGGGEERLAMVRLTPASCCWKLVLLSSRRR
ncbi:hypothetical protein [Sphingomonas sp. Ant H11]|uniref:hypothetical protein n=1 Tax=Sphingomonas sp. Ant H11 TaxID=1564113 RepID=UPI001E3B0A61|nr:hypothetical protein [Sphingomonas sp. Ant H11]